MLHEYRLDSNAAEATRRINKARGEGTVGDRFREFKSGNEDLTHKKGVDRQSVLAAIEESPSLTIRILAEDFDCDHSTIVRILQELGKVWRKAR